MNSVESPTALNNSGDIDLIALVEMFWAEKLLISALVGLFLAIGWIYTERTPERWTSEVQLIPPAVVDLNPLNPPEMAIYTAMVETNRSDGNFSVKEGNLIAATMSPKTALLLASPKTAWL